MHVWYRFSSSGSVSAAAVLQRHRRLPGVSDVHLHHVWLPRPSGDLVLVGNSNVCQETLWMLLLGPKAEWQTLKMQWCVVQYVGRWTSQLVCRAQCPRFIYSICMQMAWLCGVGPWRADVCFDQTFKAFHDNWVEGRKRSNSEIFLLCEGDIERACVKCLLADLRGWKKKLHCRF